MEASGIRARGLICAGGEATRLQELTRITNKHLLPVGRWPMVYYPLQLMQRLGIRDVLLVTGQGLAGDFIDLLGDGRVRERNGDGLLFDLDLTYKVQTEPGGIAQVVGMAESFAGSDKLVVCLGDNIFEYAEAPAIRSFAAADDGAYDLTPEGLKSFTALGIDVVGLRDQRRRFAFACLDWSERRPHLGGALGAALLGLALRKRWVSRDPDCRALMVTAAGRLEMLRRFGLSSQRP